MTNYSAGHDAEKVAAKYLETHGYKIVALNWKHARAEIDIVAEKKHYVKAHRYLVFFEVKYRRTSDQGRGYDYITPRKIAQMRFAADLYVAERGYTGEYMLGAIEISGEKYIVENCIENIS